MDIFLLLTIAAQDLEQNFKFFVGLLQFLHLFIIEPPILLIERLVNSRKAFTMKEKCLFCKETDLVHFNEHYVFCKNCTAIYTNMMLTDVRCTCFVASTAAIVVERVPWFKDWWLKYNSGKFVHNGKCSKCGCDVIADGW